MQFNYVAVMHLHVDLDSTDISELTIQKSFAYQVMWNVDLRARPVDRSKNSYRSVFGIIRPSQC